MNNLLYVSIKIKLPPDLQKSFEGEIIFTDNFSSALENGAGVILSPEAKGNKTLYDIRQSMYPVLLWACDGNKKTARGSEDDSENPLNVYFEFQETPDSAFFSRIVKNYRNSLLQAEREKYFREESEKQEKLNREFLKVGIALSAERDNSKLLNYIVVKIREITRSDAGSLYLLDADRKSGDVSMIFKIAQNDSNPTDFSEFRMPVQKKSIAGYVAITGEVIKLDDAYSIPESAEYGFNKSYDENTGYRTKSMLTVPMKNHKNKIIGVIQLINKKREMGIILSGHDVVEQSVIPFDRADVEIVLALSSLAAVSLDNNQLYHEIEDLFECLVRASAKAIEQRDPATSGHSSRVAKYTVALAEAVSRDDGAFSNIDFTEDHLKGLRYACLLHDFGKYQVNFQNYLESSQFHFYLPNQ